MIWLQNLHRTEETDSWRAQTKPCVHQDPGERSGDPTRDWARLAWECLWRRHGSAVACCRVGVTEYGTVCMRLFEVEHHYLHYLHHSLASVQTTEREHSPTHQQKIGLNFPEHGLTHQNKTQILPQCVPSGSFHKPLILIHQRTDRLKTTIKEN